MVYDGFHTSDLKEACAELSVWQRERLKTRMLGGVRLSCGTGKYPYIRSLSPFLSLSHLSKPLLNINVHTAELHQGIR